MAALIPEHEKALILAALKAGDKSLNQVARDFHRGAASISRLAHSNNVSTARARTKAATEAKTADLRSELARLAVNLASDAERMRQQLFEPHMAYAFGGRDNQFNEHEIAQPTPQDKARLMTAIGIAIDKVRVITAGNQPGVDESRGMIVDLLDGAAAALRQETADKAEL